MCFWNILLEVLMTLKVQMLPLYVFLNSAMIVRTIIVRGGFLQTTVRSLKKKQENVGGCNHRLFSVETVQYFDCGREKAEELRLRVNYRMLNSVSILDRWPIFELRRDIWRIRTKLSLIHCKLFSGFLQIIMCEICKEMRIFIVIFGNFRFEVMFFCSMNDAPTLQKTNGWKSPRSYIHQS